MRINHEMLLTKLLRGHPRRRRRLQRCRERSTCARVVLPSRHAAAAFSLCFVVSWIEESEESLPSPFVATSPLVVAIALGPALLPSLQERGGFLTAGFSLIQTPPWRSVTIAIP